MAFTSKGNKWELKNSLYLIFSFIPFFNSICFFHMDGKVNNKKWKRIGWIVLALNIFLVITTFTCAILSSVEIEEIPYDTRPKLEDYLGRDYYDKYKSYTEYSKLQEYYDYEDAVEAWRNSNEIKSIDEKNEAFQSTADSIGMGSLIAWFFTNLIVFFYLISQRAHYLKALAKTTNKNEVINRLENMNNIVKNNNNKEIAKIQHDSVEKKVIRNSENKFSYKEQINKVDINTASEQQLVDLPLLTIVDAKKAINYRDEHNGFESVDEFFTVINAKPHIIVKLENTLFVSNPRQSKINTSIFNTKRRIDL